jgi:sigma-B regulation protein RsbQ
MNNSAGSDCAALRARYHIVEAGAGSTTLVLAHGFGCDQNMWRRIAPALAAKHRVVTFDLIGAGRSDVRAYDSARHATLHGYAQDFIEVAEAIGASAASPVVLVGHSVSATIALLASVQRPELFERLILICPSPRYLNDLPGYAGGFDRATIDGLLDLMEKNPAGWPSFLAPLVMKNPDRPELGRELEQSFCTLEPRIAQEFARATFLADNRADLAAVTVPSLILQCRDDAIAPESVGRYMHAALRGSTLHEMAATGHCPHVSHPEETLAAIESYLAIRRSHGA